MPQRAANLWGTAVAEIHQLPVRTFNVETCNHQLTFSFGRHAKDNHPVARTLTFRELVDEFSTPDTTRGRLSAAEYHALGAGGADQKAQRAREKDGPYFMPCELVNDGRRCSENIETLCGIALDFDSGATAARYIRERLKGRAYVAYTTYSHRPDHPKLRVFVPYARPVHVGLQGSVLRHFQQLFEGQVDPHCGSPAQFAYTPSCPLDAIDSFESFHEFGDLFDPEQLPTGSIRTPHNVPDTNAGGQAGAATRLGAALAVLSSDDRKTWIEFGIAIKHELGDAGLAIWLDWSRKSEKFDLNDGLKTWASFKDETTGPKITVGTIYYMARERGWVDADLAATPPPHIARVNQDHFLAPQAGKALIFKEGVDPLDGRQTLQAMSIADFKALHANQHVDSFNAAGKHGRTGVADSWLTHPARRQYDGLVLAPNRDVPGYYNLWRGFAVEPRPGVWKLMHEHIRTILCKGNAELTEYVLNWLASCVQHPDRRAEVALVLCGGRGVGKGIFVNALGSLFGSHFVQISNARHLTGNFNAHLRDCIVLFVDEAFWAGDKQGESVLKHCITEATLPIERKGCDLEIVPNLLHVVMASNNAWVVPAGLDERRYCVLNVDDSKQQDAAYFGALSDEIEHGGREAMLHDLLKRDISKFEFRKAPKTDGLLEQKLLSMEPWQHWFFECLQAGTLTGYKDDWQCVQKSRVQASYTTCLKDAGTSRRAQQTELGMRLGKLLPAGYPKSVKVSARVDGLSVQLPHYRLPPLDVCRKHFETLIGLAGYDWDGQEGGGDDLSNLSDLLKEPI